MEGPCHRRRVEAVSLHQSALPTHEQSLSLTESIPPTHKALSGGDFVGYIEPNDEIRQQPAVLLLLSLVAISWIVLERFEWSGNWVVITPNLPSFAPRVNSWQAPGVWRSMATTTAQGYPCLGPPVNVGLH